MSEVVVGVGVDECEGVGDDRPSAGTEAARIG